MLGTLDAGIEYYGLEDLITPLELAWDDDWDLVGPVAKAVDVAFASRSVTTTNLKGALAKLDRTARRRCAVTMVANSSPRYDLHLMNAIGASVTCSNGFVYAFNILIQMGALPQVTYFESPRRDTFNTLEAGVADFSRMLEHGNEDKIDRLRDSFALGNAIKEGVPVAIAGAPNVGKSTLLNRLLGEERAMVSEIAGTTRDVIEECANIGGVLFRFLDTAGIRTTDDHLERMGIERTMASIRRARIVIRLTDATAPEPPEQFALRPDQTLLRVVNKLDLRPDAPLPEGAVGLSARNGEGIDRLCRALRGAVDTSALYHGDAVVSNSRHYAALTQAREALSRAIEGLDEGLPTDLLSEEIRQVIRHLGSITGGDISAPEVLSHIFSNFCVGK